MQFLAVSTFNKSGLDLYGRRMMGTFRANWPKEVQLRTYSEGWVGDVDLVSASPWLAAFKERHKGRTFKDYRWDAVRFSHKVAAVCHAASTTDVDVLIWVDGDVVTHSPISLTDLEALAPSGDEWIAWLDRANVYPECGFYLINCRHPRHAEMMAAFESMYADDKLFGLKEYHDSYVLEQVVKASGVGVKSISGDGYSTTHPLINGPLGSWFDHAKGRRKAAGRSDKRELKTRRTEKHWQ